MKLVGRLPEYINGHSIITPNSENAALEIREKYGIMGRSSDLYFNPQYADLGYGGDYEPSSVEDQVKQDYAEYILNYGLPALKDGELSYFACHCGFIDKDLFSLTSLTVQRMNDVAAACDPRIKKYIEENDIKLVTYRDLY